MSIENNNKPIEPSDGVDEALLQRYLDGRLEDGEQRAIEETLRANAAARRRLDALREEEKLLREALESLSEPGKRLGDKVIATLHSEERSRQQSLRVVRIRRHAFAILGAAAAVIMCLWLVKPREAAGTMASGGAAKLLTPAGEVRVLSKDMRFYEGDQITTAQGQFVRLRLADNSHLDLDEHSKLRIGKPHPLPTFTLEAGRLGVVAQQDMAIQVPQGSARLTAGATADVWLPQPVSAVWPETIEPAPVGTDRPHPQPLSQRERGELPAVITVLSGRAWVANEKLPSGVSIDKNVRVMLWAQRRSSARVTPGSSQVLETRAGRTWHTLDGVMPEDHAVLGLLDRPDFIELSRRLNMTTNTPKPVEQAVTTALQELQTAAQMADAKQSAEKLAAAQQALRLAYEPLKADDERRAVGRLLEGLAHLERGRALQSGEAAAAAFDAARVAFEESLRPDPALPPPVEGKPEWAKQLATGPGVTARDLSPANQAGLLAAFHHAVARCWQARTGAVANDNQPPLEKELDDLQALLGHSVESLALRLAHGLAEESAGRSAKAAEALEEILAVPLAGWSESGRRHGEGIRQTALLSLARANISRGEKAKALAAAEDFRILYPLDIATPAAQAIQKLLDGDAAKQVR